MFLIFVALKIKQYFRPRSPRTMEGVHEELEGLADLDIPLGNEDVPRHEEIAMANGVVHGVARRADDT
jgi:hypothetical protein